MSVKILVTCIIDLKKSQHNRPHQFVRHLSKKHDVTVVSINDWWKGSQDNLDQYSREFDEIFGKVNYIHLTSKKTSPILQEMFSGKKVNESIKDNHFDVHLNYSTLVSGYFAARKLNTVYDIADDLGAMIKESPQIPSLLRPIGGMYGDYMVKKNIQLSNRVTVTTDNLSKAYQVPDTKSEVIPNGVNTTQFRNCGSSVKDELKLNGFIVGYVGVLREWVDFEPVFAALRDLNRDISIVIVGKEGMFRENIELARKYCVEDRVIFTGMVPYSQVPKYISAMDVCLVPFKRSAISENAVPLKLFEYMACEKPVISTRLSGIEKIAGDRILYVSGKEDYKTTINTLYQDSLLRKRLGETGKNFVDERYDWTKLSEQMERTLINAAGMS